MILSSWEVALTASGATPSDLTDVALPSELAAPIGII
jgi:hypothetical protein